MSKHIGNDHDSHTRFRIIDIDSNSGSVLIQYDENAWLRGQEQAQQMSWVEFVEGLKHGRFEIHRTA